MRDSPLPTQVNPLSCPPGRNHTPCPSYPCRFRLHRRPIRAEGFATIVDRSEQERAVSTAAQRSEQVSITTYSLQPRSGSASEAVAPHFSAAAHASATQTIGSVRQKIGFYRNIFLYLFLWVKPAPRSLAGTDFCHETNS